MPIAGVLWSPVRSTLTGVLHSRLDIKRSRKFNGVLELAYRESPTHHPITPLPLRRCGRTRFWLRCGRLFWTRACLAQRRFLRGRRGVCGYPVMPDRGRVIPGSSDRGTCLLQAFAHSSLCGLSSIRYCASCGLSCVGHGFARFMSDFLCRIFGLLYGSWLVLILCYHQTKREQDRDG